MSDIREIAFVYPSVSFTANHEAGTEPTGKDIGAMNVADRIDGQGNPILEQVIVPKGITLPNVIIDETEQTIENLEKAILDGKGEVTVSYNNGTVLAYQQAIIVADTESNRKKSTISIQIQAATSSSNIS